jgi:hypothetical protein
MRVLLTVVVALMVMSCRADLGMPTLSLGMTLRHGQQLLDDFPLTNLLARAVWTNFVASTNARTTSIWLATPRLDIFPGDSSNNWPLTKAYYATNTDTVMTRRTNSLIYGFVGSTAISQFNTSTLSGQTPFTLITRRHAYARGHDMGLVGGGGNVETNFAGLRVFFVSSSNTVHAATITKRIGRIGMQADGVGHDYCIVIFSSDLPLSIDVMPVMTMTSWSTRYINRLGGYPDLSWETEQWGNCFVNKPIALQWYYGWVSGPAWKGGDSGSPNMIAVPTRDGRTSLVMHSGRSTSGPSALMQRDIDALTVDAGLNTNNYQMTWFDFTGLQ